MLTSKFNRLVLQLAELLEKSDDHIAHRATAVALLHHKITGVSWTGFYMLRGNDLIVETYQGPVACQMLERNAGVCWAAIKAGETIIVPNVHAFEGHITCDARSQSEIVVPIRNADREIIGVLDVDSTSVDHFIDEHRQGYENVINALERKWWGTGGK